MDKKITSRLTYIFLIAGISVLSSCGNTGTSNVGSSGGADSTGNDTNSSPVIKSQIANNPSEIANLPKDTFKDTISKVAGIKVDVFYGVIKKINKDSILVDAYLFDINKANPTMLSQLAGESDNTKIIAPWRNGLPSKRKSILVKIDNKTLIKDFTGKLSDIKILTRNIVVKVIGDNTVNNKNEVTGKDITYTMISPDEIMKY